MDEKNKNDSKISDFNEMKKKLEEEKQKETKILESDKNQILGLKEIFDEIGIKVDSETLENLMGNFDLNQMPLPTDFNFSLEDLQKSLEGLKDYEKKIKQEKQMYRSFGQWVPFRRPYNLTSLFQIEFIKKIADDMNISYTKLDSKNQIIEKIKPDLHLYVERLLLMMDEETLDHLGRLIYADGSYQVDSTLKEDIEIKLDFLASKSLLARVNDNGKHCIVLADEIKEALKKINFQKTTLYSQLNTIINQTTIAMANSYGAYPKSLLYDKLRESAKEIAKSLNLSSLEEHIDKVLIFSFARNILSAALYQNVIISDTYINHGIIEVTKNLIDIQNENIDYYKDLSKTDIQTRGNSFYYEDSIYLSQIIGFLQEQNDLDSVDIDQMKNQIYIFSFMEFEPSLILQLLEMKYQLPDSSNYGKFIEIFRNYYANSEKWILKGHTSFEINKPSNPEMDMKNIISFDYFNKEN